MAKAKLTACTINNINWYLRTMRMVFSALSPSIIINSLPREFFKTGLIIKLNCVKLNGHLLLISPRLFWKRFRQTQAMIGISKCGKTKTFAVIIVTFIAVMHVRVVYICILEYAECAVRTPNQTNG